MDFKTIKEEILFLDSLSNPTERDKQLSAEMQQLLQLRKTDVSGSFYCFESHIETGECNKQCKECKKYEST